MPSENGLAQELGISRGMVQRAYGVLEQQGVLSRSQGQRWRIVAADETARSAVSYEDVAAGLRLWLTDNPGVDGLPTGSALAKRFQVSVDTVGLARKLLVERGELRRAGRRYVRSDSAIRSSADEAVAAVRNAIAMAPDDVAPGGRLIGERAWIERLGVSKKTVRAALAVLEADGVVSPAAPGKPRALVLPVSD